MIEPYYKDEMVTLYLGRCESILPQLEVRADLLLTDPPYGHDAWNKNGGSVRVFRHLWNGLCRDSEVGVHLHPTQKPVKLMAWCMEFFPKTKLVLDPYAGSGTTLVAAKLLGRSSVGIEMNEKYCQMIVDRLNKPIPLFEQEEQLNAFAANSA